MADAALLRIGKARIGGAPGDARDMLVRALDPVTPAALGLPPRATLIVRRMAVKTPLPRSGPPDRFAAALRDGLRARAVSARRVGQASDDADLLFEDDAAFEAAIVADWLDRPQAAATRWWVPGIGLATPPERWRRSVFADVALLPPILARLGRSGHAAPWLARFDDGELAAATARLMAALAPGAGEKRATAPLALPKADGSVAHALQVRNADAVADRSETRAAHAAIDRIAPEASLLATPSARRLMTVALVAVRRPALLSTAAFAAALAEIGRVQPLGCAPDMATGKAATPEIAPHPGVGTRKQLPPPQGRTPSERSPGPASPALSPAKASRIVKGRPDVGDPPHAPSAAPLVPSLAEQPCAEAAADPVATPLPVVETQFGGLFFLLNAFVALGLYGTLADPRGSLRGLSPFELLDLLGRRWFGRAFARDPLHALLRDLSGLHRGERPGAQFEAPPWSVPDDWLAPWPEGRAVRGGRWHSAGFPLTADARHWLSCFARYMDARLVRALGEDGARDLICCRPARTACDGETVEITMTLDTHPLAIRLAGLDRDPGWLPAAGRRIGFVFS